MERKIINLSIILFLVFALAVLGQWDYEHEQDEAEKYCYMVQHGLWPDYRLDMDCNFFIKNN
jgi:hypothetical protein